jgi:hypothetical protein
MSEEKSLANVDESNPLAVFSGEREIDKEFEDLLGTSDYLPYVIIMGKSADLTGPPHECIPGNFYLIDNEGPTYIGPKMDVHITEYRMKALKYKKDIRVISSHDINDPLFESIKTTADKLKASRQRSDENGFSYLWGPEYLIWLGDLGEFATFFCSNATLKRAAREMIHRRRGKVVTFEQNWIQTEQHSWWGIKVYDCSTPLAINPESTDYVNQVVQEFKNMKNVEVEKDPSESMFTVEDEIEDR